MRVHVAVLQALERGLRGTPVIDRRGAGPGLGIDAVREGVQRVDTFRQRRAGREADLLARDRGGLRLSDRRGHADRERDRAGRELKATWIATADQVAAAADLARGGKDAGDPAVVLSGLDRHVLAPGDDGPGVGALLRSRDEDLFG